MVLPLFKMSLVAKLLCFSWSQFHVKSDSFSFSLCVLLFTHLHLQFLSFLSPLYMIIKLLSSPFLSALTLPLSSLSLSPSVSFFLSLQQSEGYFYPECHCSARAHTSRALAAASGCTLHHAYTHTYTHTHTHVVTRFTSMQNGGGLCSSRLTRRRER